MSCSSVTASQATSFSFLLCRSPGCMFPISSLCFINVALILYIPPFSLLLCYTTNIADLTSHWPIIGDALLTKLNCLVQQLPFSLYCICIWFPAACQLLKCLQNKYQENMNQVCSQSRCVDGTGVQTEQVCRQCRCVDRGLLCLVLIKCIRLY